MKELRGACIIGQSGGPTSVINASAYGVIATALKNPNITRVLGAEHGIKGVLNDRLFDMGQEDPAELELLYDYRLSMLSGWVCGILAMILIPGWQAVHWAQIFVQQLVCFSCLGYAGVFGSDKRWKAICGMALAVAIRCFGHVISGVIFYSQNAWDGWGAWGYSLAFNLSSRLPEGILSILIVSVLPLTLMRRAIARREAK